MGSRKFDPAQPMFFPSGDHKSLKIFQNQIEKKYNVNFKDYWELHKWSVDYASEFWEEVWKFSGVICSKTYDKVIDQAIPFEECPEWFPGARMNYAENLLKYRDDFVAFILAGEDREIETVTYAQLYKDAELFAAAFRKHGLKKGDIVACFMSNRKEAVSAMLGAVSIGAIFSGALPLLGAKAVSERFKQIKPKYLVSIDRFKNQGEEIDMLTKLEIIVKDVPSVKKVLIVASKQDSLQKDIHQIRNSCFLSDFLASGRNEDGTVPLMQFEQVPVSYPVFISFTSGTTGPPKSIIHDSGCLLHFAVEKLLHFDSDRNNIGLSISPVGWASWTIFVSTLFTGKSTLLYEGIPFFISPTYFWDLVDECKLTSLMLVPSVLEEFERKNIVPTEKHSLASVKRIWSGGTVVKPSTYDFVYRKIKKDILFASSYGCTELMGCCAIIHFSLPAYRGEIPVPFLGSDLQVVDDQGKIIEGEVGELVLCNPSPNFLRGYLSDDDGSRVREKYFSKFPGKFALGDFGIRNPVTKGFIICFRSDETLKQRGWRFGSVEIYNVVDPFPEVLDCLCVSRYTKDYDEHAVLFLQIRPLHECNEGLVDRIRKAIARELTPNHVPDIIIQAPDIPYNLNGKKMEVLVKKIINKMPHSTDDVRNPQSLHYYYNVPELKAL